MGCRLVSARLNVEICSMFCLWHLFSSCEQIAKPPALENTINRVDLQFLCLWLRCSPRFSSFLDPFFSPVAPLFGPQGSKQCSSSLCTARLRRAVFCLLTWSSHHLKPIRWVNSLKIRETLLNETRRLFAGSNTSKQSVGREWWINKINKNHAKT